MSKEHPILFSTPMVQAILDGRKTQTRRIVKDKQVNVTDPPFAPGWDYVRFYDGFAKFCEVHNHINERYVKCPYGKVGDVLWARETWAEFVGGSTNHKVVPIYKVGDYADWVKWKPSIHMKKAYARIWLEVTNVRVERLHEISRGDATAEGCPFPNMASGPNPREWFQELWNEINGAWSANPWVWAIEFKVLSTTGRPK